MAEINALVIIDHYKELDKKGRVDFRQKVLDATGMAYTSFYNKIIGKTDFTKSELFVISQILNDTDDAAKD